MSVTLVFWLFPVAIFIVALGIYTFLSRAEPPSKKRRRETLEAAFATALLLWGFLLALLVIRDMIVEPTRTQGRVVRTSITTGYDADNPEVYVVELQTGADTTYFTVPREAYDAITPGDTVEFGTTNWVNRLRYVTILEGVREGYHHGPSLLQDVLLAILAVIFCPIVTTTGGFMAVLLAWILAALGRALWQRVRPAHV